MLLGNRLGMEIYHFVNLFLLSTHKYIFLFNKIDTSTFKKDPLGRQAYFFKKDHLGNTG